MVSERMLAIKEAAIKLFLTQGYSRTQISHIAKEVGVSVGTIYHDFNGKKEIMNFVLKSTIDPEFIKQDLERPITEEVFDGLHHEIMSVFEQNSSRFAKHLKEGLESYDFEQLMSDTFDMLEQYAVGCLFLEKNQFDFKKLAEHYKKFRREFLNNMVRYLELFIDSGSVRPLDNLESAAVLIVETLSWWAMDMRYTAFDTYKISREEAKRVCLDNLITAYVKRED